MQFAPKAPPCQKNNRPGVFDMLRPSVTYLRQRLGHSLGIDQARFHLDTTSSPAYDAQHKRPRFTCLWPNEGGTKCPSRRQRQHNRPSRWQRKSQPATLINLAPADMRTLGLLFSGTGWQHAAARLCGAGFITCCIADFQIGAALGFSQHNASASASQVYPAQQDAAQHTWKSPARKRVN